MKPSVVPLTISFVDTGHPRHSTPRSGSVRRLREQDLQPFQQRVRVTRIHGRRRPLPELDTYRQFLEPAAEAYPAGRAEDLPGTSSRNFGHPMVAKSIMVCTPNRGIGSSHFRSPPSLFTAAMGTPLDRPSTVENSTLDVSVKPQASLARTIQESVLKSAGTGQTEAGITIANLMPMARADNTWRTKETLWKKWTEFCSADGLDPFKADEGSLLRYLGWLYIDNRVSGNSVRQYLSAVTTTYSRIGLSLELTPFHQLAITAYQKGDEERKILDNPERA